jgi:hypothetical protein
MGAVWVVAALAVVVVLIAVVRRVRTSGKPAADVDLGSVSESWVSEQRGRKDS